jgi:hypothetical protein
VNLLQRLFGKPLPRLSTEILAMAFLRLFEQEPGDNVYKYIPIKFGCRSRYVDVYIPDRRMPIEQIEQQYLRPAAIILAVGVKRIGIVKGFVFQSVSQGIFASAVSHSECVSVRLNFKNECQFTVEVNWT